MSWLLLIFACGAPVAPAPAPWVAPPPPAPVVAAMRTKRLVFTRHGECRMACRHISEKEVRLILMEEGTLAPDRSRDDGECMSHALEGHTADGQDVRIVFAACADETRVVTAIDLGKDWPCECM